MLALGLVLWTGCGAPAKLAGTTWQLTDLDPSDPVHHKVTFEEGGRLRTDHPRDTTSDDDEWVETGDGVQFWYNNRFSEHSARYGDEDRATMEGEATNIRGYVWRFRLRRL